MTRTITGAAVAICIGSAAAVVAAQQTPGAQTGSNPSSAQAGAITVTGCLQKSDQPGAVGTTGTTGSQAGSFMLTNATRSMSGAGATSGAGTTAGAGATAGAGTTPGATAGGGATAGAGATGATPGASAMGSGSSYILEGGTNLAQHAGHRVEVTGTLSPGAKPAGTTGAAGAGATAATGTAGSASAAGAQRLQVTSVRMVSADCK
jgi:hypothetical protein